MSSAERVPLLDNEVGQEQKSARQKGAAPRLVTMCILFTELCERLTFYSINGNMVLFCTNVLLFTSASAVTVNLVFTGTCYFVPVFGGWIADSISGSFNCIYGGGLLYVVGTLLLPVVAFDFSSRFGQQYGLGLDAKRGYFITGLALVAIGTGTIKANVSPFGAEQLKAYGPDTVQSFFSWFYWFVNVGSGIAYSAVAYVQQEIGFDVGYLIPTVFMILALVIFCAARSEYIHKPPEGSVLTKVFQIIGCSFKGWNQGIFTVKSFLDYAKSSNGGSFSDQEVEEVKYFGRIIPVFLTLIIYNTIYNQMTSTFLLQGERMDLKIGSFTLPAASLNLFDVIIILILVPIVDRLIFPLLAKYGKRPTLLQRMGFGMLLATCAVLVAGGLEIVRKDELATSGGFSQNVGGKFYNSSHVNILWQVPQFAFIGASEVFTNVAALEFAYSQAPEYMSGIVMGLNQVATGLGSYVGSLLLAIVNAATTADPWYPNEINDGHVEYFFFLLSGLMFVDFIISWSSPGAMNTSNRGPSPVLDVAALYTTEKASQDGDLSQQARVDLFCSTTDQKELNL